MTVLALSAPAPSARTGSGRLLALVLVGAMTAASCAAFDTPTSQSASSEQPAIDATAEGSLASRLVIPVLERRDVRFSTPDGEELNARIHGQGSVGVVLAHMRGQNQSTWTEFADRAAAQGFRVLTFDFRGYGASTGARDTNLDVDLKAAIDFLRQDGVERVVVIGASMGATASINVAAELDLSGVVSLSAPANFLGLDALGVAPSVAEPLLLIATELDTTYAADATYLDAAAPATQLLILEGQGHGTNMFANHSDELNAALMGFLAAQLTS